MAEEVFDDLYAQVSPLLRGKIVRGEPMAKHTTLRVGGKAALFASAETVNDLRILLEGAHRFGVDHFILGKGSNLLVSDAGYSGLVIQLGHDFRQVRVDSPYIQAGAAVALAALTQTAQRRGLEGLAFAVGIPGSLGGAVVLNAGAHGSSMSRVTHRVTVYTPNLELRQYEKSHIRFGYRTSSLVGAGTVVEVVLKLQPAEPAKIGAQMARYFKKRKETQPTGVASAGSIFKNPPGAKAGALIEKAGCKGMRVGGAEVSTRHANFIVNLGAATAEDVYNLLADVQAKVFAEFGVTLEPEIVTLGRFERVLISSPA